MPPTKSTPADLLLRQRNVFGAARTPYVREVERRLRQGTSGTGIKDPDFALARDPEFWEKIEGNATIRGARDYRRHLVAGPRVVYEAPSPRDQPLVPVVEALMARLRRFAAARHGFADASVRGLVTGRLHGHHETLDLLRDGRMLRWYLLDGIKIRPKGRWSLQLVTAPGEQERRWAWAQWDYDLEQWALPENPDWYVFHRYDDQEDLFHGRGMDRALYWLAHAEHVLWESGLDTAERFGAPWIRAKLNPEVGGVSPGVGGDIDSFVAAADKVKKVLEKLRAHNILVGDARLLDVDLMEANLRGADLIKSLIEQIQMQARILLLGSNLPTAATTGGSFSLAQVQDESTQRLVRYDRELLGETLSEQVVARLVEWNRPALAELSHPTEAWLSLADLAPPRARIADDEVDDPAKRQFTLTVLQATGIEARREDVYALAGLEMPGEGDATVKIGGAAGPGLFREPQQPSPVWRDYAEGRWGR